MGLPASFQLTPPPPLWWGVGRCWVGGKPHVPSAKAPQSYLEERLLDKRTRRCHVLPYFGVIQRSIPQSRIWDVQPIVKSSFWETK